MSKVYSYMRVSTKEQQLDRQEAEILEFAKSSDMVIERSFEDKASGKSFDRPAYEEMKSILVSGDVVIVKEMDRLGRNKEQIKDELDYFKKNGIRVIILDIPTTKMDFSKMDEGIAKAMMEMVNNVLIEVLSTIAEEERKKIKKRQAEGISAMKVDENGKKVSAKSGNAYGRPKANQSKVDYAFDLYTRKEKTILEICEIVGISKSTLMRKVREEREKGLLAEEMFRNKI